MKIQLDTENKTITINEDIKLHDFHEQINVLLPGGLWREFTLKVGKINKWKDPIIVDPYKPPNINQPWNQTLTRILVILRYGIQQPRITMEDLWLKVVIMKTV